MSDLAPLIERLEQVALECRATIREAHETIKDLKAATKEAKEWVDRCHRAAEEDVAQQLGEQITAGLEELGGQIKSAQDKAVDKVFSDMDRLGALLGIPEFIDRVQENRLRYGPEHRSINGPR